MVAQAGRLFFLLLNRQGSSLNSHRVWMSGSERGSELGGQPDQQDRSEVEGAQADQSSMFDSAISDEALQDPELSIT
eukprot:SAG31_NODE_175_length_21352_cov_3.981508_5_plen_77_part_00